MAVRKFAEKILSKKPVPFYGNGQMERDYTFISDIVDGVILALEKPLGFQIINLGGGCPVSVSKLLEMLQAEIGAKAIISKKPIPPGDVPKTIADYSKATNLLGWNPKVPLKKGIAIFVKWMKNKDI